MAKHTLTIPDDLEAALTWARSKANAGAKEEHASRTAGVEKPDPFVEPYPTNASFLAQAVTTVLRSYDAQATEEATMASLRAKPEATKVPSSVTA